MTDAELLSRAAEGDQRAFDQLYERHWKAVYSYAWLLARSVPDAEDATQECFLSLIRQSSFDPARAKLRTWLLAVVRNQVLQRHRNQSSQAPLNNDTVESGGNSIDEELMKQTRADALRRAFDLLPSPQREALFLFEFEGLSLAEVAAVLEIEPNAVKARLFRGREQLKRILNPQRPALSLKSENVDD